MDNHYILRTPVQKRKTTPENSRNIPVGVLGSPPVSSTVPPSENSILSLENSSLWCLKIVSHTVWPFLPYLSQFSGLWMFRLYCIRRVCRARIYRVWEYRSVYRMHCMLSIDMHRAYISIHIRNAFFFCRTPCLYTWSLPHTIHRAITS